MWRPNIFTVMNIHLNDCYLNDDRNDTPAGIISSNGKCVSPYAGWFWWELNAAQCHSFPRNSNLQVALNHDFRIKLELFYVRLYLWVSFNIPMLSHNWFLTTCCVQLKIHAGELQVSCCHNYSLQSELPLYFPVNEFFVLFFFLQPKIQYYYNYKRWIITF